MKSLPVILVVMMLAGCAGMGTSGGNSMSGSDSSIQQWNRDHHNDPSDIYFGG